MYNDQVIDFGTLGKDFRRPIEELGKKYGVGNIRVFGSVARGEEHAGSDLDLLVSVEPGRTLLDLVGFEQDVSSLLNIRVQAISERAVSPYMKARVLAEARPL